MKPTKEQIKQWKEQLEQAVHLCDNFLIETLIELIYTVGYKEGVQEGFRIGAQKPKIENLVTKQE